MRKLLAIVIALTIGLMILTGCSNKQNSAECENPRATYFLYSSEINEKFDKIKVLASGNLFDQVEQRALIILLSTMLEPTQDNPECFDSKIVKESKEILDEINKY
jgi:hypothetical protein